MLTEEVLFGQDPATVTAARYDRVTSMSDLDPIESDWLICNMVPEGSRVLDIGCGTGVLMSLLQSARNASVIGVEPNEERALVARCRGHNVYTGVLSPDLLAMLGKFDVVLFADVLEHLVDPAAVLQMIIPHLTPQGRIVASIPNIAHWTVRFHLMLGRFDYEPMGIMDSTHLRWFTEKSVRSLFASVDFFVSDIKHSCGHSTWRYTLPPFTLLPKRPRRALVHYMTKLFPRLFGFQHICFATKS